MRGVGYGANNAAAVQLAGGGPLAARTDTERVPGVGPVFSARMARGGIATRAALRADLRRRTSNAARRDRLARLLCGPTANHVVESSFDSVRQWLGRQIPPITVAPLTNAWRLRACGAIRPKAMALRPPKRAAAKRPAAKRPAAKRPAAKRPAARRRAVPKRAVRRVVPKRAAAIAGAARRRRG